MLCISCNTPTDNPKYCSRSCAAKENNKKPKRKKTKLCHRCSTPVLSKHKFCKDCRNYRDEHTLGELIYTQFHKTAAFNVVRLRAKSLIKKIGITSCENCGYDKHIECAHIIPLCKFPLDTKVYVANATTNLIGLCPNCHWEFDKGLLPNLISKIDRLNKAA